MSDLDGRVAALEVKVSELVQESGRSRTRLHSLENTTAALVQAARERTAQEERRNRERIDAEDRRAQKFGRRIQVLTLTVAALAVVEPLVHAGAL